MGITEVNWSHYPPALRGLIQEEVAAGNVAALKSYEATWSKARDRGDKGALLAHLEAAVREAATVRDEWERRIDGSSEDGEPGAAH